MSKRHFGIFFDVLSFTPSLYIYIYNLRSLPQARVSDPEENVVRGRRKATACASRSVKPLCQAGTLLRLEVPSEIPQTRPHNQNSP